MQVKKMTFVSAVLGALMVFACAVSPWANAGTLAIPRDPDPAQVAELQVAPNTASQTLELADIDTAMRALAEVMDASTRTSFLDRWKSIHADVLKEPKFFVNDFRESYHRSFRVYPRTGKYGSMVRPSIVKAEESGLPEEAPISMREALGVAAGQSLTEVDVAELFARLYTPDTATEAGKKASMRYFAGYYKSAYAAGEFRKGSAFDREAASLHRGRLVLAGDEWKALLRSQPAIRANVAKALNHAMDYFERNGIRYSPEGYRKYVTHLAMAIARVARADNVGSAANVNDVADIVYAVAPALDKEVPVLTLERDGKVVDLVDTARPEVGKAWTAVTDLPYIGAQTTSAANVAASLLREVAAVQDIAKMSENIARLDLETAQMKQETAQMKQETEQNKEISAVVKQAHLILVEVMNLMNRYLKPGTQDKALVLIALRKKVDEATENNETLTLLATRYNDEDGLRLARLGDEKLNELKRIIRAKQP